MYLRFSLISVINFYYVINKFNTDLPLKVSLNRYLFIFNH
jgi:hypothetical protein